MPSPSRSESGRLDDPGFDHDFPTSRSVTDSTFDGHNNPDRHDEAAHVEDRTSWPGRLPHSAIPDGSDEGQQEQLSEDSPGFAPEKERRQGSDDGDRQSARDLGTQQVEALSRHETLVHEPGRQAKRQVVSEDESDGSADDCDRSRVPVSSSFAARQPAQRAETG
jgi:hypothetical protein